MLSGHPWNIERLHEQYDVFCIFGLYRLIGKLGSYFISRNIFYSLKLLVFMRKILEFRQPFSMKIYLSIQNIVTVCYNLVSGLWEIGFLDFRFQVIFITFLCINIKVSVQILCGKLNKKNVWRCQTFWLMQYLHA